MQQSDLMIRSSKDLTYMYDLHIFDTSCVLKAYYMWCANEIYYSQAKLS